MRQFALDFQTFQKKKLKRNYLIKIFVCDLTHINCVDHYHYMVIHPSLT